MAGHRGTSPGFECYTPGISDATRVAALRAASPQLKWANTADRGYVTVQLTRERVTANWHSVETIGSHRPGLKDIHSMTATRGRRKYRSEEHTSELQSLMRISYAVFCVKKTKHTHEK